MWLSLFHVSKFLHSHVDDCDVVLWIGGGSGCDSCWNIGFCGVAVVVVLHHGCQVAVYFSSVLLVGGIIRDVHPSDVHCWAEPRLYGVWSVRYSLGSPEGHHAG